jgi:AcrR family transcriptional regulator
MTTIDPQSSIRWRAGRVTLGRPAAQRVLRPEGEDMARRLLAAGRAVFDRRGFDGARVDDIAAEAAVSHGTFYLYFHNKEELLHLLALECAEDLRGLLRELAGVQPADIASWTAWLHTFVSRYRAHGAVVRVWLERRDPDPLMQALGDEILGRFATVVDGFITPELAERINRDVITVAVISMIENLCFWQAGHEELDERILVETLAQLLSGGFSVGPGVSV